MKREILGQAGVFGVVNDLDVSRQSDKIFITLCKIIRLNVPTLITVYATPVAVRRHNPRDKRVGRAWAERRAICIIRVVKQLSRFALLGVQLATSFRRMPFFPPCRARFVRISAHGAPARSPGSLLFSREVV